MTTTTQTFKHFNSNAFALLFCFINLQFNYWTCSAIILTRIVIVELNKISLKNL